MPLRVGIYRKILSVTFRNTKRGYLELRNFAVEVKDVVNVRFLASIDLQDAKEPGIDLQSMFFNRPLDDTSKIANIAEVKFSSSSEAKKILENWEKKGLIYYAEPNHISKLSDFDKAKSIGAETGNYDLINLAEAFYKD